MLWFRTSLRRSQSRVIGRSNYAGRLVIGAEHSKWTLGIHGSTFRWLTDHPDWLSLKRSSCRGKAQLPPPATSVSSTLAPPPQSNGHKSRSSTPQLGADGSSSSVQIKNGIVMYPCLACGRQISSNRYAPHLASCLGLTGSRRTARATATGNGKSR